MAENKDIPQFVACGLEMGNCGYQIPYDMAEHERIIRADAIDDYTEWLRKAHANFDEDYAEDIKSDYLEQLKEQK